MPRPVHAFLAVPLCSCALAFGDRPTTALAWLLPQDPGCPSIADTEGDLIEPQLSHPGGAGGGPAGREGRPSPNQPPRPPRPPPTRLGAPRQGSPTAPSPTVPAEPPPQVPGRLRFAYVHYSDEGGTRVLSVAPGCAADLAGVAAGDLIVAVDHIPTTLTNNAADLVLSRSAGDLVVLTVRRGDDAHELTATLSPPGPADVEYRGTLVEVLPDP